MSLFLGPIHHILHEKIIYQDELSNKLMDILSNDIKGEIYIRNYKIQEGNLEDIIDKTNIHGWLDEQVNIVESKLAFILEKLIENNKFEEALRILYDEGKKVAKGRSFKNCIDSFQVISNYLLDGMPCDNGITIISKDEYEIIFEYNRDVHSMFKDFDKYMNFRFEWIKGLLSNTPNINIICVSSQIFKLEKE